MRPLHLLFLLTTTLAASLPKKQEINFTLTIHAPGQIYDAFTLAIQKGSYVPNAELVPASNERSQIFTTWGETIVADGRRAGVSLGMHLAFGGDQPVDFDLCWSAGVETTEVKVKDQTKGFCVGSVELYDTDWDWGVFVVNKNDKPPGCVDVTLIAKKV